MSPARPGRGKPRVASDGRGKPHGAHDGRGKPRGASDGRDKQPSRARADARGVRLGLLRAAFNAHVVDGLADGARSAFVEAGGRLQDVEEIVVPGAFELPQAAFAAALSGRFDALVACGAVIRGETDHYEHVAREASAGLQAVARETLLPLGFAVLTVSRVEHALARSAPGADNKGAEALHAAIAMVHVLRQLSPPRRRR